jgi:tetratricopeptide (TPR) repeat protein
MRFFGFWKNRDNTPFRITETDRLWVEENFHWLIQAFGYPYRESEQILLSEKYFPKTFKDTKVSIDNIIDDLCLLLQIQKANISFEVLKDVRDIHGIPYEIQGKSFETELGVENGNYKIYVAHSLLEYPQRLIYSLVYELIKIKLIENKLQFDTGEDTDLFLYLAGIYFGYGVMLSQNMKVEGRRNDGVWETKWNYISEMPIELMAFALATYAKLIEQDSPKWMDDLPSDLQKQFAKAIKYLGENSNKLYDKNELEANDLFYLAHNQYLKNEFKEAIANLKKILPLTNDDVMKAYVYNNLGYYNLRLSNYKLSVSYFKNALQLTPKYGYACDNLAYALIQLGELKQGKEWLDKAMESENNNPAYTYRNYALYYQAKGDVNEAQRYFKMSFEATSDSVDLLEFHYADFLIKNAEKETGLEFLRRAVEKGEPEAIRKMKEIND